MAGILSVTQKFLSVLNCLLQRSLYKKNQNATFFNNLTKKTWWPCSITDLSAFANPNVGKKNFVIIGMSKVGIFINGFFWKNQNFLLNLPEAEHCP
jgi:predicted HTH transcriptional regulator